VAGSRWRALADLALPAEPFGRVRELLAEVHATVIEGGDASAPAAELWALRRQLDAEALDAPFAAMAGLLEEIYEAERAASGSGAKKGVET
jgi:hypothetical protein